jgi:hypothetical protein
LKIRLLCLTCHTIWNNVLTANNRFLDLGQPACRKMIGKCVKGSQHQQLLRAGILLATLEARLKEGIRVG